MTIQELYETIGGNYQHALQILKMDKLIDRYVRKLESSGVDQALVTARETMDPKALFEAAHGMKGICANLGLDDLAAAAEVITEEYRPGNTRKMSDEAVNEKLDEITEMYQRTLEGIRRYVAES
ncbi:MAG: Hpt domain-containing protein [Solobacterium sp.]|nr:Hpt domain-containing protein [Solobacterium sp.]